MGYTKEDIKSVFKYLEDNPGGNFKSWLEYRSSNFTKEDLKRFSNISYCRISILLKGKEYYLYLIKSNKSGSNLNNFLGRYVGNRGCYQFAPDGRYGYPIVVMSFDEGLFKIGEWDELKGIYDTRYLENKDMGVSMYFFNDINDDDAWEELESSGVLDERRGFRNSLERGYQFWNYGIEIYIKDINSLEFSKVDGLLEGRKSEV